MLTIDKILEEKTYTGLLKRYGDQWLKTLPTLVDDLEKERGWSFIKSLPGGRTAAVLVFETLDGQRVVKIAPRYKSQSS